MENGFELARISVAFSMCCITLQKQSGGKPPEHRKPRLKLAREQLWRRGRGGRVLGFLVSGQEMRACRYAEAGVGESAVL